MFSRIRWVMVSNMFSLLPALEVGEVLADMVGDGGGGEVGDGQVRILISDNCKQIRLTVSHKYDTDQLRTQEILLLFLLCRFLVLLIKLQTLIST